MGNEETEVKNILFDLERLLLTNIVRTDKQRISELLDEHFKEHTSSGKVYHYTNGDIFGDNKEKINIFESSFEIIPLSSDVKLVTYQTIKKSNNKEIKTNRSSIWKKTDNKWKIVFHQGTISTE